MHEVDRPWKRGVVLVCTNRRPDGAPRPSCGRHRAEALRTWLKEACRQAGGPLAEVRVLATSCLDVCPDRGVAVALEPAGRCWVADAGEDGPRLLEALGEAAQEGAGARGVARRLVERLKR